MSLETTYEELRRHIGRFIGAGRNSPWTATNTQDINDSLTSGLREFYWPSDDGRHYTWSFLRRSGEATIAANTYQADLPSDFSQLTSVSTTTRTLGLASEDQVSSLIASDARTGDPLYYAVRTKSADPSGGIGRTGHEIIVYPTPAAATVISFRYAAEPETISSDADRPLGGAIHSETILEACLAAAEKVLDPEAGEGIHAKKFAECLKASIDADRKLTQINTESTIHPLDGEDGSTGGLEVNKAQLKRIVGQAMTFGANPAAWTHGQTVEVSEVIRGGLRKFYQPMTLPGERSPHNWSFLQPLFTMALSDGGSVYDLPDDFALIKGSVTYEAGSSVLYPSIEQASEETVRYRLQREEASSRPSIYAVRPKKSDETVGTRYEILFWPVPEQDYNVTFRYAINPDQLKDDEALPLGGQPHAQTIIEACLAEAESKSGSGNSRQKKFEVCLVSSVGHDREASAPDFISDSRGNSDGLDREFGNWHGYDENIVTYNGIAY